MAASILQHLPLLNTLHDTPSSVQKIATETPSLHTMHFTTTSYDSLCQLVILPVLCTRRLMQTHMTINGMNVSTQALPVMFYPRAH